MRIITAEEIDEVLVWRVLVDAVKRGHLGPRPQVSDSHLSWPSGKATDSATPDDAILVRTAHVPGVGSGLKAATIHPGNPGRSPSLPSVHGTIVVFSETTGVPLAVLDGTAVTRWKTAADSVLGAELLARQDVTTLLMIGAGAMSRPLVEAHCAVRPSISRVLLWNRTRHRAEVLADELAVSGRSIEVFDHLDTAVAAADLVCAATMSTVPLILGADLMPGTHIDLVGGYTPEMREADDEVIRRGRVFVDFRDTTVTVCGDICGPLQQGLIGPVTDLQDLYDLVPMAQSVSIRRHDDDITVFKNGGGAHLDLMTAQAVLDVSAVLRQPNLERSNAVRKR